MLKDEFLLREWDDWPLSLLESLKLPDILQEPRSESVLRELEAELLLLLCSSLILVRPHSCVQRLDTGEHTSDHVLTTSLFCILLIPIVRLVDLLLALKTFKYKKDMKDIYNIVSMAHLVSKKIRLGGMATEL